MSKVTSMDQGLAPNVDEYSPDAAVPAVGSWWAWEVTLPHARCLVVVNEVRWNGEEWWVRLNEHWNELGRFYEACLPVGDAQWIDDATRADLTRGAA